MTYTFLKSQQIKNPLELPARYKAWSVSFLLPLPTLHSGLVCAFKLASAHPAVLHDGIAFGGCTSQDGLIFFYLFFFSRLLTRPHFKVNLELQQVEISYFYQPAGIFPSVRRSDFSLRTIGPSKVMEKYLQVGKSMCVCRNKYISQEMYLCNFRCLVNVSCFTD